MQMFKDALTVRVMLMEAMRNVRAHPSWAHIVEQYLADERGFSALYPNGSLVVNGLKLYLTFRDDLKMIENETHVVVSREEWKTLNMWTNEGRARLT